MRASTNEPVSLTHSQQMNSYRSCGPRGIRKEDDGTFMSGDNSMISFKQFFELMKDKTFAKGSQGGIDFEHSEKNVSCCLLPQFGYN